MSNSRSFRRKAKADRHVRSSGSQLPMPVLPGRPPWNKGLTLTATPSMSTMRRRLRTMETAGLVDHETERTGKPGRPPHLWSPTKDGWALYDIGTRLERVGYDTRILLPRDVDLLVSHGYAARRDDGTVAFLEDYQAAWKYWNSKKMAAG